MRKTLALSLLILGAVLGPGAFAQNAQAPRSVDEIVARWDELRPTFGDWAVMRYVGNFEDPFSVGALEWSYIQDGIDMLNFVRFLVGLPDDVVTDLQFTYKAQALSAISAMNGYHSHTPEYPEGMPKDIFDEASPIGGKSNLLSHSFNGSGLLVMWENNAEMLGPYYPLGAQRRNRLAGAVLTLVNDADTRNVFDAEHRRNTFRPQNSKVGFGYIDFYEEWEPSSEEKAKLKESYGSDPFKQYSFADFITIYIVDKGRAEIPDYDYITWPARGYMPSELLGGNVDYFPWSVTLNPAKYKVDDPSALTVEIAGVNSKYKVSIGKKDKLANQGMLGDEDYDANKKLKKFLLYQPGTASWLPDLLFYPGEANLPSYSPGDRYKVTIGGLKDAKGKATTISYWTEFFSLPHTGWISNPFEKD